MDPQIRDATQNKSCEKERGKNYQDKDSEVHLESSTIFVTPSPLSLVEAISGVSPENRPWGFFDSIGEVIWLFSRCSGMCAKFNEELSIRSNGRLADAGDSGVSAGFAENSRGLWNSKCATVRSIGLVSVSKSGIPVNLFKKWRNKKSKPLNQNY